MAHMAEQWIEASAALRIAGNIDSLCARLHSGLAQSRAAKFEVGDEVRIDAVVPKGFWWAEGHESLKQDWATGDFSTWIDQKHHRRAFGVQFALSGLLEMVDFERRPVIARSFSVAANNDWLSASEARRFWYSNCSDNPASAGLAIVEQARLGFVAARAILAQTSTGSPNGLNWDWEEREWNIPGWFWQQFTIAERSHQNWELAKFSGKGRAPVEITYMTLSGVHFHRASLEALVRRDDQPEQKSTGKGGRNPAYDWDSAVTAIWGEIHRGELIPDNQAQVEVAMIRWLAKGDKEPSESTVRPFAKRIWTEFSKA